MDFYFGRIFKKGFLSRSSQLRPALFASGNGNQKAHPKERDSFEESPGGAGQVEDALQRSLGSAFVSMALQNAISEIVVEFEVVRRERDVVPEKSPEWHKLTGQMLAYARATAVLQELRGRADSFALSQA
jgi:hypothetical protein